ncbi:MAG: patatin-like phospholipase family protein [Firmicutes bacterium]|nr:patatin-like phospholipase family protein [Bacillota bacterium]
MQETNNLTNQTQKTPYKVGLALGGGAARGFCHIGVLKVLQEHNIPLHCISGCSIGALVGGAYAAGVSVEDIEKLAQRVSNRTLRDLRISFKKQGFFKGGRVMQIIRRTLGDKTFQDCAIPFAATAVEIQKARLHVFTSGPLSFALRASMSVPAVFHYVENAQGERFVDGDVLERIPIDAARNLGADFIIAVDAIGPVRESNQTKGIFNMFERMLNVMNWEINKQKILNLPDFLITPDQGDRSMQHFKNNLESVRAGEAAARQAMPELLKALQL